MSNYLILFVVRFICTCFLAGMSFLCSAQTDTTLYLQEVNVYGIPVTKYTPGSKIEQIRTDEGGTLTDLLSRNSPLYFKTYGNGQLATVAFRGTSASQTAVLWNGINVNPPTLGQTDFSLWPSFLLEEITLQYGAGSALYGTDALGGSVLINSSEPRFSKKSRLEVRQEAGSFGHWLSGAKAVYGSSRLEFRTKVYYRTLENDFEFTSPRVGYRKKQHDAAVESYGFDQQVFWKVSSAGQLSVHGQYTSNFREIQPTVTNNSAGNVLEDKNTRTAISYRHDLANGSLFATVGYILNDQLYNKTSRTRTDQLTALAQYDFTISRKSSLRTGGNWTKYFSTSSGFDGQRTENRFDLFASFRHRVSRSWLTSLNIRQSRYATALAPLAPSWGNEFTLKENSKVKVTLHTQLARGYRVPTLNDRYWIPGGNPDLKAEDGFQAEAGVNGIKKWKKSELAFEVTHHRLWINQWIIWLPNGGVWSPSNLSKVNVSGIESQLKYKTSVDSWVINTGISYAFTRSLNKRGLTPFDKATLDKQLPYVPAHSGHIFARAAKNRWGMETQLDYTGLRYTTLDNTEYQSLEAYVLLSAAVSRSFPIAIGEVHMRLSAGNLFNVYYENIENTAMPGRNYLLSLTLKF